MNRKIPCRSLNKLTAKEAGKELAARGEQVLRLGQVRKDHLRNVLLGAARVPAALTRSPTTNIYKKELGQERLQIMSCEPLHDLKSAFSNTLTELDRHLLAPTAQSYNEVIDLRVVPTKGKALAEKPRGYLLDSLRIGRRKNTKMQRAERQV